MKLFNTLTMAKEEFVPIEPGKVGIYYCGPTVYDYIHIGNARPCAVFDTVRRYLLYRGYDVTFVQNYTDVDDKIIRRANDEGVDCSAITGKYIAEAYKDACGLNAMDATFYPKVTEEMDAIIEMIQVLADKGFAYENGGNVYFDTSKVDGYGKLSHKKIDELESGARVAVDTGKRNSSDFVLWKPDKPGEPKWDSPWGTGRPGWHIECSVMARKYLGDTIDIHGGGEDLIFPHHENEIAQSEAANGVPFVNYWLHNGMINIDNQKMSKSKGNFFLLRDITKHFSYDVVRFYILSVHYRSPINFSDELLNSAKASYERIRNCFRELRDTPPLEGNVGANCVRPVNPTAGTHPAFERFKSDFITVMDDDFNTANAITVIFELVRYINSNLVGADADFIAAAKSLLNELCEVLGLKFEDGGDENKDAEVEALINERTKARAEKDWTRSDEIRDLLAGMGVVVKDTADGVKWHYK